MLMSAILDPRIFDNDKYCDANYKNQSELFLDGILSNGLLIIDADDKIITELINNVEKLSSTTGQLSRILIEELLKNKKTRFISLKPSREAKNLTAAINILCSDTKCDAIITAASYRMKYSAHGLNHVVSIEEYSSSRYEKGRKYHDNKLPPIDLLSCDKLKEIVGRTIYFAKHITIYDKYIGHGTSNVNFRKAIEFIIDIWRDCGYFASKGNDCNISIVTCPPEKIQSSDMEHVRQSKIEANIRAKNKVITEILQKLKQKYSYNFDVSWKIDNDDIFHARHLDAEHCIVLVERGFDLLKSDGTVKRCIVKIDNTASGHLQQCCAMPEYKFTV